VFVREHRERREILIAERIGAGDAVGDDGKRGDEHAVPVRRTRGEIGKADGIAAAGVTAVKFGQKNSHVGAVESAIGELGDIYFVRNSFAKLLWQEGLVDEAVKNWELILEKHPYQADVIAYLARAYVLLSRQDELQALLKKFSNFNLLRIKKEQCYPLEVDPEYFVLLVSETEYFSRITADLSQLFADLGDVAEAIRWQRISLDLESKKR